MSDLKYEFLTYEEFTEDQYIMAVAEVCINDVLCLPYVKMKNKDGGHFWGFSGCGAMKNGVKKRFAAAFDSRSAKIKFEAALQAYIDAKSSSAYVLPKTDIATLIKQAQSAPPDALPGGEPDWSNSPF
jgi:hypothetical protein